MMGRVRVTSLVNIISVIRQLLFFSKKRETAPYLPSPQFVFLKKNKQKITLFLAPKKPPTNPNPQKSEYEIHKKNPHICLINSVLWFSSSLLSKGFRSTPLGEEQEPLTLEDGFTLVSVMQ